jgi:carboxymethylenebutenolidase
MNTIKTDWIETTVADGTKMAAYVARPDAEGPLPGVLVFQEIFGVNSHIRDVAERVARAGYVALAPDIFHRFAPRYDVGYDDVPASIALTSNLTPQGIMADIVAAHAALTGLPGVNAEKIGAMGFCMGGRLAYAANALTKLAAAVSFYGGGIHTQLELVANQGAPILFLWGGKDGYIAAENRHAITDAFSKAEKPYTALEVSFADHGFYCDARGSYNAHAAAIGGAAAFSFLATYLK